MEWRALVDQHERLVPDDTQAATLAGRRLEGLHPDCDPEPGCGRERLVKEMLTVLDPFSPGD